MDPVSWALFVLVAAGALGAVLHVYRRREAPGRGRTLLAAMRWLVIAILLLLLFDPEVPVPGLAAGREHTRILVDASLSMALPVSATDSTTRWQAAVGEARRLTPDGRVLLFGEGAHLASADSLPSREPTAVTSRLLPALQAASEAGARRVIVLTDGGIEDLAEVQRMLPRLGLDVDVRSVIAGDVRDRAIAEVDAPVWAKAGEPLAIDAGVVSTGAAGDTVTVVVHRDGRTLATERIAAPEPGRVSRATLEFEPQAPDGGGLVRYDVALAGADASADDDVRSVYVYVGERPAGIALVSLHPDWEPRFLQPVLEQALGLPVRGFLRTKSGRYVELGEGADAGATIDEAAVRRAVAQADLLVVHGLGADAPKWTVDALRTARRSLVFPDDDAEVAGSPVALPPVVPGEWYPSSEVPSSPVAPLLTSVRTDDLAPLSGLRPLAGVDGAWTPLLASRDGRGAGEPVVVAAERDGRRWAVATAHGFWRWAFRGGEARQVYRRLWSSLGGWLVQEQFAAGGAAVRPVHTTTPRGAPIAWVTPGLAPDSIAVTITADSGETVADTVVAAVLGDTLHTAALAPGHYRYRARAFAHGEETSAEGPLSVEAYSPEFTRAAASLGTFDAAAVGRGIGTSRDPGQPLHTLPWAYLLLVLLVSTEWILRRRWGLR